MTGTKFRNSRLTGVGVLALGSSVGSWIVHPAFGAVLACAETALGMAVIMAGLFGSDRVSERAFRLLRWVANRPEPLKAPRR
ncbi:hypothetical protein [Planomonospora venezuelensis]|uniref:Uncharacterized protein n=1 Tax=Planomonospora venezuelensis TaxID=1999 RepID=A0A841DCZ7_PLAVE|nr:hypothetical protein [Planomonospora venezuelensis]MBB5965985.1 hypothetical protein [Planomonospora venezuelensis]GIN01261.1 hypothetical protein Pve01_29190 [Planomonospora venezuelensis]